LTNGASSQYKAVMTRAAQRILDSLRQARAFARGEPVEGMRLHVHGHPVELHPLRDGDWQAVVPDLPGCMAGGDTMHEAVASVARVGAAWLEHAAHTRAVRG
jgi:predicted RNase H-like HicB family nuclease